MRGWMVVLGLGLAACSDVDDPAAEGSTPGSCDDGADNDLDGFFDCDDQGCWGSPDCDDQADTDDTEPGTDDTVDDTADTEDTEDTDEPAPNSWVGNLKAVSLRYLLEIEPTGATVTALQAFGAPGMAEPCSASFYGEGVAEYHLDGKVRFQGSWEMVDDDCPKFPLIELFPQVEGLSFASAGVWVGDDPDAYHTFVFPRDLEDVTSWVAHADPSIDGLTREPFDNEQYWIKFTESHTYDAEGLGFDYYEEQLIAFEGLIPINFGNTLEVRFSDDDTPPALDPFPLVP